MRGLWPGLAESMGIRHFRLRRVCADGPNVATTRGGGPPTRKRTWRRRRSQLCRGPRRRVADHMPVKDLDDVLKVCHPFGTTRPRQTMQLPVGASQG